MLVVVTLIAGWLVFGVNDTLPVPFLLLATSVWAGTRFSPWVADLHALLLVTGVVVCTVMGQGPFAEISDPLSQVLVVQALRRGRRRAHARALGRALREPRPQPAAGRRGGRRHRAGDDDAHDPRHDGRRRQRARRHGPPGAPQPGRHAPGRRPQPRRRGPRRERPVRHLLRRRHADVARRRSLPPSPDR